MTDDLELVLAFLHTREASGDELRDADAARQWLSGRKLIADRDAVTDDDVRQLFRFRAAITDLIVSPPSRRDPRTQPFIEQVTQKTPLVFAWQDTADGPLAIDATGSGVDRAMSLLLAALYRASLGGELNRLKACKSCGWAFFDTTKNRSRVWCEMATCGSREKARAFRGRRKGIEAKTD